MDSNNQVLVSVITPVFNASRFIARAIRSVQEQGDVRYEHIIVDDRSTDNSLEIIQALASTDERIKVISFTANQGVVEARNAAIAQAQGRYLSFLDADDIWLPNKLHTQVMFMQEHDAALSYSDYRFISEDGSKVGLLLRGPSKIGWALHHMTRYLGCLTVMVDKSKVPDFSFGKVSPKYRAEDFIAWSSVLLTHKNALRCPHDLARYTVVKNSRSSSGFKASKTVWRVYRDIESIGLVMSVFYFVSYLAFSTAKRIYCRPRFTSQKTEWHIK